jgi:hypothetical protein
MTVAASSSSKSLKSVAVSDLKVQDEIKHVVSWRIGRRLRQIETESTTSSCRLKNLGVEPKVLDGPDKPEI